jgi:SAM-dependent methyltransferase
MSEGESARLREFWNRRYAQFSLSESGWLGAGEDLNDRIYACKEQALRRAIDATGIESTTRFSVLDAGCGQGYFPCFYARRYPAASYVGLDISERAVEHLRRTIPAGEFHVANLCEWIDPAGRQFDIVQCLDVLYLILDDDLVARAFKNFATLMKPTGALFMNAAVLDETIQQNDYLRHRSRAFWDDVFASAGLRVRASQPMYYFLPAGGPSNRYLRYALTRLGAGVLYAVDRLALAAGAPQPASGSIDSRMQLLTVIRQ